MNEAMLTTLLINLSRNGIELHGHPSSSEQTGSRQVFRREPFYPPQKHEILELICRMEGDPIIHTNGNWTRYTGNTIKVFAPGAWHTEHYAERDRPYQLLWGTILEQSFVFHLTSYTPGRGYSASNKRLALCPPMIRPLWDLSIAAGLASSLVLQAEFHTRLMEMLCFFRHNPDLVTASAEGYREQIVEHLKTHIEGHFWEDLTLEGLANVFHYSPKHLNTLFRRATGRPVHQRIMQLRLERARDLLASGNVLVKQVADAVGIHDPLYFSRLFRQHFGFPPQEFRRVTNSCDRSKYPYRNLMDADNGG